MNEPTFLPTDDGFRDALARSRRRRARRHAVAASASGTALAVVAFVALTGGSAAPDSLQQRPIGPAGAPPPTASGSPAPPATESPADGRAGTSGGGALTPVPDGTSQPRDELAAPEGAPASAGQPRDGGTVSTPARRTTTAYEPNAPCADTTARAVSGWCMQTDPPRSGIAGRPVDLSLSLCRLPGFGSAAASFPTTAEAGYALDERSGGGTLWDHAEQHPGRPARHEHQVEPGRCLTWTVTWTNRLDDGEPVPPGSYELRLSVLADNVSGPNTVFTQKYAYTVEEVP